MTATASPATMDDVAALAGVSTSTVSRALRDSPLISPATRERVRSAAAELDFALSRTASALATGRLGRIGLLVSGPLNTWFNSSVLDAAYATLRDAGQELVIYSTQNAVDRSQFFATLPAQRNVDALIVASFALTADEYARLAELSVPVVYLNQRVEGSASVFIDDAAAAATGARHLINLGHRRIAYVTTRDPAGFHLQCGPPPRRGAAGRRAAQPGVRHRSRRPPSPSRSTPPAVARRSASSPSGSCSAAASSPRRVVTESDEVAMSLLPALQRAGLRVPADLSVLGFDDNTLAPLFDLTTVAQPVAELGHAAARAALALTRHSPVGLGEPHQELATRLVLRGSTAVPRP